MSEAHKTSTVPCPRFYLSWPDLRASCRRQIMEHFPLYWFLTSAFLVYALQWPYNGHDDISNHQPHDCLLARLFRRRSKKTSKRRVTGLCAGNWHETAEFLAQMASNAEKCFHLMTSSWYEKPVMCNFDLSMLFVWKYFLSTVQLAVI